MTDTDALVGTLEPGAGVVPSAALLTVGRPRSELDGRGSGVPEAASAQLQQSDLPPTALGAGARVALESLPVDDDDDETHLVELVARAQSGSGREHLTSLSALSQQLSSYPPLDPDAQFTRILAYRRGVAASAESVPSDCSPAERRAHARIVQAGQRAQTELVGSMYRLALLICQELAAERYGRERMLDMLADLVSEANIAVVEAVGTYDETRSPAFSLYAGRVMRDRVRMMLQKSATVGVAPSWLRLKRIYTVLRPEVEMRLGRTPTEVEMQAELRAVCLRWAADRLSPEQQALPEGERDALMESKLRKQGMLGAIDRLSEVLSATQQTTSLDAPLGDGDGARLGDVIAQPGADSSYDAIEHDELRRDLMQALSAFTERERTIVLMKYGFVDGEQWTYARLAPRFGVSAERIRQIERNVLSKLRAPTFTNLEPHLLTHQP